MIELWKEFFNEYLPLKYMFLGALVSAILQGIAESIAKYIDRRNYEIKQREERDRNNPPC